MSTRLGIGLAAVGRPAYITARRGQNLSTRRTVEKFERRAHVLLDAAFAAGVRYVDVARSSVATSCTRRPRRPECSRTPSCTVHCPRCATRASGWGSRRHVAVLAARAGVSIDQLAVATALAQPWAWRVLSGAATPEHLASHVAAADLVLVPLVANTVLAYFVAIWSDRVQVTAQEWISTAPGGRVDGVDLVSGTFYVQVRSPGDLPDLDDLMSDLRGQVPDGLTVVVTTLRGEDLDAAVVGEAVGG